MTLPQARQNYEVADAEMVFWARQFARVRSGSKTKRVCFRALDIASTRREEALAQLWQVVDAT